MFLFADPVISRGQNSRREASGASRGFSSSVRFPFRNETVRMKESVLMMMKMKPAMKKGNKGYFVHCPQCGQFLMVLSKEEAVIHCPQCGTDKKAVIRGGRITIYELAGRPEAVALQSCGHGRAKR